MNRWLVALTIAMSAMLAINSVLGPFVFDVVAYGFPESVANQGIGLDAVSLLLVAPLGLLSAWATSKRWSLGPLVALAVAAYTAYMLVQYLVGPNYTYAARIYPFQLVTFVASLATATLAWQVLSAGPPWTHRRRLTAGVMFGVAAFVVLRYLPTLIGAAGEDPLPEEYTTAPAFFWTIVLMDLGIFVPAAIATGVGVLRQARWAAAAALSITVWFTLVTVAVWAMALTMVVNDDPYASDGQVVLFLALSVVTVGYAGWALRDTFGPRHSRRGA
ncbi:MAG: hypothetical protein KC491_01465 [Dehalococcoidia bacterium]|nr:hypothetical protein [Dehalococcoidia bacterium]